EADKRLLFDAPVAGCRWDTEERDVRLDAAHHERLRHAASSRIEHLNHGGRGRGEEGCNGTFGVVGSLSYSESAVCQPSTIDFAFDVPYGAVRRLSVAVMEFEVKSRCP